MLQANAEVAKKLAARQKKYDVQFRVVFDAIRADGAARQAWEAHPVSIGGRVKTHVASRRRSACGASERTGVNAGTRTRSWCSTVRCAGRCGLARDGIWVMG
jgi:hypothetical protein